MGLVGMGFSFAVSSVTATVVNTAPTRLAGMAAATTSMVRDFGFAMGPALIGAIALSKAAGNFNQAIAGVPALAPIKDAAVGTGPVVVNSVRRRFRSATPPRSRSPPSTTGTRSGSPSAASRHSSSAP